MIMKRMKIFLTIALFAFMTTGSVLAQKNAVQDIFDKYTGQEGFTSVQLGNGVLSLLSSLDKDDPDLQKMARSLHSLKILIADESAPRINFEDELKGKADFDEYKELMTIKEKDENVRIMARENGGTIKELLMLVNGTDENVLIFMDGSFLLKDLASMGSLNVEGIDHLKELEK